MDVHFGVLGIPRGCDEVTMKRAYHQKALALHPDRNPKGAEQFKKVGEAYEALRAHFRLHGGRDVKTPLPTMWPPAGKNCANPRFTSTAGSDFSSTFRNPPTGSGFQHVRRAQPFCEEPPQLFTDSGMFGYVPGGFMHERQPKASSRTFSGCAPSEGTFGHQNSDGPLMSSTHEKANDRWRRAHGDRVPVSGYSNARGDPGVASMQGAEAAPKPRRQPLYKENVHAHQSETKPFPRQSHPTNVGGKNFGMGKTFSQTFTSRNGHGVPFAHHNTDANDDSTPNDDSLSFDDMERRFSDDKQHSTFSFDFSHTHGAEEFFGRTHHGWPRVDKGMAPKMEKTRGGASYKFSKEEEDYVVRKAAADEEASNRRKERDRLNAVHAKGILDERLMLKKVLFTQLYTPDPADVALMPDSDVYVLCELLKEVGKNMARVLEGRMTKGLCAHCSVAAKSQSTKAFSCPHPSVCEGCALTCAMCPVCGAGRK